MNRQRLKKTMCVALSWLLYLWDLEEQRGKVFLKLSYADWREVEKSQETSRGTFMGRHKKTTQGVDD